MPMNKHCHLRVILSLLALAPVPALSTARAAGPGAKDQGDKKGAAPDLPLPRDLPPLGKDRPLPVPVIKRLKTPEGLQVWLVKRGGIPKVTAVLAVRGGTASDPPGMEGIAEVLAQVLKEGTKKRTSRQIAEEVQALGGDLETHASDDAILVTADGLASGTSALIELLADIARGASFPDAEVELARANALQDLKVKESTPEFLGLKVFSKAVFGDHPYHTVAATREVLSAVGPDLLRREFARRFRPEGSLLVVVGDIDVAAAGKTITQAFAGWKGTGAAPAPTPVPPAPEGRKILVTNRAGSVQSLILVGRPTVPATHPDYYPLVVANTIFGGSFGSRLTKNIREDKGYSYSPGAKLLTLQKAGVLRVRADVRNEVSGPTLKEIFGELDRMGSELPTGEELNRAKRYQSGLYLLRNQIQNAVAQTLATNWVNGLPPEALGLFVSRVNQVSAAQIKKVGQAHFPSATQTVVVVGDEARLKTDLSSFGPVISTRP